MNRWMVITLAIVTAWPATAALATDAGTATPDTIAWSSINFEAAGSNNDGTQAITLVINVSTPTTTLKMRFAGDSRLHLLRSLSRLGSDYGAKTQPDR